MRTPDTVEPVDDLTEITSRVSLVRITVPVVTVPA